MQASSLTQRLTLSLNLLTRPRANLVGDKTRVGLKSCGMCPAMEHVSSRQWSRYRPGTGAGARVRLCQAPKGRAQEQMRELGMFVVQLPKETRRLQHLLHHHTDTACARGNVCSRANP
jgi:hypothetical protein